jgi:DNA segregation ATPase FtsK/SpoIIIE, S-DNA-T family
MKLPFLPDSENLSLEKRVGELEKEVFKKSPVTSNKVIKRNSKLPPLSLLSDSSDESISYKYLLEKYQTLNLGYCLPIILGTDRHGKARYYDIAKAPHLLIAGTPGSGLTVFLWNLIVSLLFHKTADQLRFVLVDPKRSGLAIIGNHLPHLLTEIIIKLNTTISAFRWAVNEMDRRFNLLSEARVRNITEYNRIPKVNKIPYIVLIVDELSDLMFYAKKDIEESIIKLTQKSRAVGIHLVLNTARPSHEALPGLMMANISCKIAFKTYSKIDSKIVLDMPDAKFLEAPGDALFLPHDALKPIEIHTPLVSEQELLSVTQWISKNQPSTSYETEKNPVKFRGNTEDVKDPLFNDAVKIITKFDKVSASLLQRRLTIGYARSARLLDELEEKDYISKQDGLNPRMVLKKK